MKDLKVKKVIGMHWGTAILSLEKIWEPPIRFKEKMLKNLVTKKRMQLYLKLVRLKN